MRLKRKITMFIHTNQPLITSFYIKKVPIFAELAMSERWSTIFCATGAWGGKPIGHLRLIWNRSFFEFWENDEISDNLKVLKIIYASKHVYITHMAFALIIYTKIPEE